jgi:hypothetical protein
MLAIPRRPQPVILALWRQAAMLSGTRQSGQRIRTEGLSHPLRRWVKLCFRGLCREDAVTGSLADKAVVCCGQGSPGRRGRDTSQDSR